jgi:hypothetical protein
MNQSLENNLPKNICLSGVSENLGIKKLQKNISSLYGLEKSEEINLLTALFIEQLADSLELLPKTTRVEISQKNNLFPVSSFPNLPVDFPDSAEMPLYLYGDRVGHEFIEGYGIVIGRFYAFDRNLEGWRWKYLILGDRDFATNSFFSSCVCWETELDPLD